MRFIIWALLALIQLVFLLLAIFFNAIHRIMIWVAKVLEKGMVRVNPKIHKKLNILDTI